MKKEEGRRKKAEKAIKGKNPKVRTFAILTSENPMGEKYAERLKKNDDKEEAGKTMEFNRGRRDTLEEYLALGNYAWFKVKGKYGNLEKSYIIYNIPLEDAEYLSKKFGQEAFIYCTTDNGKMSYQYWETDGSGVYKKTHERSEFVDMSDADDFYTKVSRTFKFQIPFFDGSDDTQEEFDEQMEQMSECIKSKRLTESDYRRHLQAALNENLTSASRYRHRGALYGGYFKSKK